MDEKLDETRASMEKLKIQLKENRYKDVFGAMNTVKEEDRSDFFKAFYAELHWRINDPNNEAPIYPEITKKFNTSHKVQ